MKTIKIMIAASEEMHDEKLEFTNLIEHLNEVLEPRGIELKRIKWNPETDGSIEEYKAKLKECEMCLTLYWRDLTGNSGQELDTAYQELKDGNNPRNLYVFFKEPTEDLTERLKDFKANFVTNYGHFFCKFENVDTMNLHFILQFEAYQNHLRSEEDQLIKVAGGKVTVADKEFVNLDNVPFAALNKEYLRLQKELFELDILVTEVRKHHKADPDNEEIEDELMAIKSKRKKLSDEFEKYQNHLYDIALNFAKTAGEKYSERMRKARELFELGDAIGADQILNMEEMKCDRLRESEQKKAHEENLEILMNEFLDKTKTVMTNTLFSIPERLNIACEAYEEAISIAREIHLDEEKLTNIFFDYARLNDNYNRMYEALHLYFETLRICCQLAELNTNEYKLRGVSDILNNLANLQSRLGHYVEAEDNHLKVLRIRRQLADSNPDAYLPRVADTLNNLAILQSDLCRYGEAEENYVEALRIYRQLAESNPDAYKPDVAGFLNNLATLQWRLRRYGEAEENYMEALQICRELAEFNPDTFLPSMADTLNNFANLQSDLCRYVEAEENYQEALRIRRQLADSNPGAYSPRVAETLNNLATLQWKLGRYVEAEENYQEALRIYRQLAESNPDAYLPRVADSLYNLSLLQSDLCRYVEAEENFVETLRIRRLLADFSPEAYMPDVAKTLNYLAALQSDLGHYDEAEKNYLEKNYLEALRIRRQLADSNSDAHSSDVAETLNNLAALESDLDRYDEAEKNYLEALRIYRLLAASNPDAYKPRMADILWNFACLKSEQKKYEKERETWVEALEAFEWLEQHSEKSYADEINKIKGFIRELDT